ncbi:MAG: ABC transporter ATP-binding protein [Micromonosporaceae bacterium]
MVDKDRRFGSPAAAQAAAGESRPVALRLDHVVRSFGGVTAVNDVSLTVEQGERLAVIGPNGAGKTTLFRLIAGEMRPTRGTVELFGRDVTRLAPHRRARLGLSRTFQVSNLFAELSVEDNIRLAAQANDLSRMRFWRPVAERDRVTAPVVETLERVGLAERRHHNVADLSHGEKRQLEIGMALVTQPRLLLLDEPAAGLSGGERTRLRELIEQLPAELPLLLIEHDMTLALELADRVLCLDNGRPIALGSPDEVRRDPHVQAVYLGRANRDAPTS